MACTNKSLPEYQSLNDKLGGNELVTDMVIGAYQKAEGTDDYPSFEQAQALLNRVVNKPLDAELAKEFDRYIGMGNEMQKQTIAFLAKHKDRTEFDEASHTYVDKDTGEVLRSTTEAINGEFEREGDFWINREAGNYVDAMLEQLLQGVTLDKMDLRVTDRDGNKVELPVSEAVREAIYADLQLRVSELTQDGEVIIPQFRTQYMGKDVSFGGSIDLLVVNKDGSVDIIDLKTSYKSSIDPGYRKPQPLGKGAHLLNEDVELPDVQAARVARGLSKKARHTLQVNLYGRMLEHAGFKVNETRTIHYKLNLSDDTITGFKFEELSNTRWSDEHVLAEAFIPLSEGDQYKDIQAEKVRTVKDTSASFVPNADLIQTLTKDVLDPLRRRLLTLEDLREQREGIKDANVNIFVPKSEQTIDALATLIGLIESDIEAGKPLLGFGRFLNYAIKDMENVNQFFQRDDIYTRESTAGILLNYERFLTMYSAVSAEVNKINDMLPKEQQKILNTFAKRHSESMDVLEGAKKLYVKEILRSSNQNMTEEQLEEAYDYGKDISNSEKLLGDLDGSSDIFLRMIARIFKEKMTFAQIKALQFNNRVDRAVEDLVRLTPGGVVNYDFMYDKDTKGNHIVVDPIGPKYYETLEELYDNLRDENGNVKTYRHVESLEDASEEDIQHNKEIFEAKEALSNFNRAEKREEGQLRDGDYHQYSDEFKRQRQMYQYYEGGVWKRRANISDQAYFAFKNKYFDTIEAVIPVRSSKGFTGLAKARSISVVKKKYVKIREIAEDGTDMRSQKYKDLIADKSEMGQARLKFYNFYKAEYENGTLTKLPTRMYNSLKHRVPTTEAISRTVDDLPTGALRVFARIGINVKRFFGDWRLPVPEVRTTKLDENGKIVESFPVFLNPITQSALDQEKINEVNDAIQEVMELRTQGKISMVEAERRIDALKVRKNRLKNRPKKLAPVKDLAGSMKIMNASLEMYEKKIALEDTFRLMRNQVQNRTYVKRTKTDELGLEDFENSQRVEAGASNIGARLDAWMDQIYLGKSYYQDMGRAGRAATVVVRKLKNALSLKSVGLNPISNIANERWGELSDFIEAAGGNYFNIRAYSEATQSYYGDYLPGVFKKVGKLNSRLQLTNTMPMSKYEATVRHFDMVRNLLDEGERGRAGLPLEYAGVDIAEYKVQSKTGIAILKTIQAAKVDANGNILETKALYDVLNFSEESKEITVDPEWKVIKDYASHDGSVVDLDAKEIASIRNYIFEVNKQLHGNYAEEDKIMLQHNAAGDLAMQFHKWVYPAFKTRWRKAYFDENLGWYEGRYVTFLRFMQHFGGLTGEGVYKYSNLSKMEQANIRKTIVEMGIFATTFLVASLIYGLRDDDEDEDTRKFMNYLLVLNDTIRGDASFFFSPKAMFNAASNPVPVLKYGEDVYDTFAKLGSWAYYSVVQSDYDLKRNKSVYYQSTHRKGQTKIAKELSDLIPLLSVYNRWEGFRTVETNWFD